MIRRILVSSTWTGVLAALLTLVALGEPASQKYGDLNYPSAESLLWACTNSKFPYIGMYKTPGTGTKAENIRVVSSMMRARISDRTSASHSSN
jgi:hypothetical protein